MAFQLGHGRKWRLKHSELQCILTLPLATGVLQMGTKGQITPCGQVAPDIPVVLSWDAIKELFY